MPDVARRRGVSCCRRSFPITTRFSSLPRHDYKGFYEKEARFRSWMHYPPFAAVSNVLVRSTKLDEALAWSGILGKWFQETRLPEVRVLGPAAAAIVRLKTEYRYHFMIKSKSREKMNTALRAMIEHAWRRRFRAAIWWWMWMR